MGEDSAAGADYEGPEGIRLQKPGMRVRVHWETAEVAVLVVHDMGRHNNRGVRKPGLFPTGCTHRAGMILMVEKNEATNQTRLHL